MSCGTARLGPGSVVGLKRTALAKPQRRWCCERQNCRNSVERPYASARRPVEGDVLGLLLVWGGTLVTTHFGIIPAHKQVMAFGSCNQSYGPLGRWQGRKEESVATSQPVPAWSAEQTPTKWRVEGACRSGHVCKKVISKPVFSLRLGFLLLANVPLPLVIGSDFLW